jgi:prevent-host-death family protein
MKTVQIEEAQAHLLELIETVDKEGSVLIAKNGSPIAKLVPISGPKTDREFGSARGKIKFEEGWDDEPAAGFESYQ